MASPVSASRALRSIGQEILGAAAAPSPLVDHPVDEPVEARHRLGELPVPLVGNESGIAYDETIRRPPRGA
jgi:hypothetical protein